MRSLFLLSLALLPQFAHAMKCTGANILSGGQHVDRFELEVRQASWRFGMEGPVVVTMREKRHDVIQYWKSKLPWTTVFERRQGMIMGDMTRAIELKFEGGVIRAVYRRDAGMERVEGPLRLDDGTEVNVACITGG